MMMIRSIKLALQRLWAFRLNSIISMGGLAIAMAVALAIFSYRSFHFSFDKHIPDSENTYRLISRYGQGSFRANTFAAFDNQMTQFAQIKSHTTCYTSHNVREIHTKDSKFDIENVIFVDSSFINFFATKLLQGDYKDIEESNIAFLSQSFSEKLFADGDPMYQQIFVRSFTPQQDSMIAFTVGGIYKDPPKSSHMQYDVLFSTNGHFNPSALHLKSHKIFGSAIYIKAYENSAIDDLQEKINETVLPELEAAHGPPLNAFEHQLQPLRKIHFNQEISSEQQPTIKKSSLNILILVGILILLIASFNFGIIHLARAEYHKKANFIIRLMGAGKKQLLFQSFIEIGISVLFSMIIAVYILALFQQFGPTEFFGNYSISFLSTNFILIMILLLFMLILFIGILSSTGILKSTSLLNEIKQGFKRRIAVIFAIIQFVIVIVLLAFTLLINKQMRFIDNKDLGYNPENIMIIRVPQYNQKVFVLCDELKKLPNIKSVSTAHHYPGYRLQDMNFSNSGISFDFKFGFVDENTFEALEISVTEYFKEQQQTATDGWYINRRFYDQLLEQYTEEQIRKSDFPSDLSEENNRQDFVLLGVIEDFHYESLHTSIDNFAFFIPKKGSRNNRFVMARLNPENTEQSIKDVLKKAEEIYPNQPIRYHFLEDELQAKYQSESIMIQLINLFSILSIMIACMGLTGLMVFLTNQRTKEIGIRKVNGATISEVIKMLNKEVVIWISISFIIASPLSYLIMKRWLENFAYQTEISWWIFLLAGLLSLLIALISVSWQSLKAARRNPVEVLRYE